MKRNTPRSDAKKQGLRYYKGNPCKHGHDGFRYINGDCLECRRIFLKKNRERITKKYREKYQATGRKKCAEYYIKNKEKILKRAKEWRKKNLQRAKENRRNHYLKNEHVYIAKARIREHHINIATPLWVNYNEIIAIYKAAKLKTEETGIKHHVDHIVPLRNKIVCGLHVPWNLQLLTQSENLQKRNRFSN